METQEEYLTLLPQEEYLTLLPAKFIKVNQPATKVAPPTFLSAGKVSKYRRIVWQPILCPTKYVFLSTSPTIFERCETHASIFGSADSGIAGT